MTDRWRQRRPLLPIGSPARRATTGALLLGAALSGADLLLDPALPTNLGAALEQTRPLQLTLTAVAAVALLAHRQPQPRSEQPADLRVLPDGPGRAMKEEWDATCTRALTALQTLTHERFSRRRAQLDNLSQAARILTLSDRLTQLHCLVDHGRLLPGQPVAAELADVADLLGPADSIDWIEDTEKHAYACLLAVHELFHTRQLGTPATWDLARGLPQGWHPTTTAP